MGEIARMICLLKENKKLHKERKVVVLVWYEIFISACLPKESKKKRLT